MCIALHTVQPMKSDIQHLQIDNFKLKLEVCNSIESDIQYLKSWKLKLETWGVQLGQHREMRDSEGEGVQPGEEEPVREHPGGGLQPGRFCLT